MGKVQRWIGSIRVESHNALTEQQFLIAQSPVLPGAIVDDPGPMLSKPQLKTLLTGLEMQTDKPAVQMSRHGNSNQKIYIKDTDKATHVYLRADNPLGLQSRYHGPYPINKRIGDTTIEVRTGTFNSGEPRLEMHSWNNAKPAYLSSEAVIAERPKLGRPAKMKDTPPSPTTAQEQLNASEMKDTDKKEKPVKPVPNPPAPPTHNMTLRQRK